MAGMIADAAGVSKSGGPSHRSSRASHAPTGSAQPLWERGLPAMTAWQTTHHFRPAQQATAPCVIAYNYARIRRLVRLGARR